MHIIAALLPVPLLILDGCLAFAFAITLLIRLLLLQLGIFEKRTYQDNRLPITETEPADNSSKRICIIGCGASGIICAKECRENNLTVVCYEKHSSVGGAFYTGYAEGMFTSSNLVTAWGCFPVKAADLPVHHWSFNEYLDYLNRFIDHFNLRSCLSFNRAVTDVEMTTDGFWKVTVRNTLTNEETSSVFHKIIMCSGTNHVPYRPDIKNEHLFKGDILHSSQFKNKEQFDKKRVLIVGMGESGSDISYLLSKCASVCMITRKGPGTVIPRREFGRCSDIDTTRAYHGLPKSFFASKDLKSRPLWHTVKVWLQSIHAKKEPQSPPDAKKFPPFTEYHWMSRPGTKSANFLRAVSENNATYKETEIVELVENGAKLADGSLFECDAILFCSGFKANNAFLPGELNYVNYRNDLWKKCFHPSFGSKIAFVGYARPNVGSIPPICELQARLVALAFADKVTLPSPNEMRDMIMKERMYEEWLFPWDHQRVPSLCSYMETITGWSRLLGCDIDIYRLLSNPSLINRVIFGPIIAAQFRIFGPGSNREQALEAISCGPTITFVEKLYLALLMLGGGIVANLGCAEPITGLYLP